MEHKTNWKLKDTVTPDDMNRIEENNSELESPSFDDSGTVEGISGFTDFLNSVKTKMNIFQFYRDFKAGMKYVLHTGKLVNNVTTTEEGFALDGRVGKYLQDQITEQNKNINGTFYPVGDLLEWANGKHKTMSASFSENCTNLPDYGNFDVLRIEHGGFLASMIAIRQSDRKMFISEYNTVTWSAWTEYVTNRDINGFVPRKIEFLTDGSIKETSGTSVKMTEFLENGNIKETLTDGEKSIIKVTKFLPDGSIEETIEQGGE